MNKNLSNDSASEKFTNDDIAENQSQPGSTGEPQVYAVQKDTGGINFTRRDFLAAAGALAGAAALAGCGSEPTPTPVPTSTPTRAPTRTPSPTSTQTPTPTQEPTPVLSLQQACQNIKAHHGTVDTLAISLDGKLLASGGADKTSKLWSLPGGALQQTLEGRVGALAISPDSKLLVTGGDDGTINLWSLPDGWLMQTLEKGNNYGVNTLAISPDGKLLAAVIYSGDQYVIKLWSLPDGSRLKTLEGHKGDIQSLAISLDGTLLASGDYDEVIKLWSLPGGELLKTIEGFSNSVDALAISPDGNFLVSGSFGELHPTGSSPVTLSLWSLPDGELLKAPEGYTDHVDQLWISPDGKMLITGDQKIDFWSLPDLELQRTLELPVDWVDAMAISSDGKLLVTSDGGNIQLWSLPEGEFTACLMDLAANEKDVQGVTYEGVDSSGQAVTYTLPCGSPIPSGAVCTCNCVAGSLKPPTGGGLHYWYPN